MSAENSIASPRLAALHQQLAGGNRAALDQFWRELEREGAPLIEALPDDADHALVTFVWRGDAQTQSVIVFGDLGGQSLTNNQLIRLPHSDVWQRSYRVRNDMRTLYRFILNLPPEAAQDPAAMYIVLRAHVVADPFNPRVFSAPADAENGSPRLLAHVLEMPAAPPQPWSAPRPGAPAGRVALHRLRSAILDNERRVWVYTPPAYSDSGEPCGLILMFDGWEAIQWVYMPAILDNLLADGLIPPMVAVMPDNLGMMTTRNLELPCYPPFAEFVRRELVPWARETYNVTGDPARCVVTGASYGGLAAAYVGLLHSDLFGNVLSLSGAFQWKPQTETEFAWLTRQYALADRLPLRFYLDAGILETTALDGPSLLESNRHMRDVLAAKGYPLHYAEYSGGHDPICWRGTIPDGLRYLIGLAQNRI
jgi:enterochelin esterase family protein